MQHSTEGGFFDRLRTWFPEREFFMRSQGQVRFITITSRVQMVAAGLALVAILGWAASVGGAAFSQYRASAERTSLLEREAHVAQSEERFGAYAEDIAATTAQLEQRQDFIEGVIGSLPEEFFEGEAGENDTVSDSATESEELISMIREVFPQAVGLAQMEARQLAFVEGLTRYADRRAARAEQAMRTLGVEPSAVVDSDQSAMGGPLETLFSEADGSIDPRFERLGLSLARMTALERGLESIPQVMPADINSISSGFGYRRDPFTGGGAMHSGLDFRAPHGAPIHAAAAGTVTFSGWQSGYGQTVEITHGSGMVTRYAHMSRFNTQVGAEVTAGQIIGAIGSTGRSTGPHLHFEVRIDGRAVNPRPFLETAPHVLEEARAEFAPHTNTNGAANDG